MQFRQVTQEYTIEEVKGYIAKDVEPILKPGEEVLKKTVFIDMHSNKVLVLVDIVKS
jgi:hypothetical protein